MGLIARGVFVEAIRTGDCLRAADRGRRGIGCQYFGTNACDANLLSPHQLGASDGGAVLAQAGLSKAQ